MVWLRLALLAIAVKTLSSKRSIAQFITCLVRNELETSVARLDKIKGEIDLFGHRDFYRSQ